MTIKTSGQLLLTEIAAEFGGTGALRLTDYYRGGAHVPSGTAAGTGSSQTTPLTPAAPAQISASGPIQMSQFYGTSQAANPISSGTLTANNTSNIATTAPKTARAQVGLTYDGRTFTDDALGLVYHANWYAPYVAGVSVVENFWFRITITSGALTTGGGAGSGVWFQGTHLSDIAPGASAHTSNAHQTDSQHAAGYIDISATNGGAILGTWNFSCTSFIDSAD